MKFLITRDFFKNIPKEKIKQVKNRIEYFYNEISKNKKTIFEAPKGFWVKKLRENLYEFRVNSGDRVLFEFRNIKRLGYSEKELVLLSFDKHDIVIVKGDRKDRKSIEVEDIKINKNIDYSEEKIETETEIKKIYDKINSKIIYEVTSDENLAELINNEDEYTYYYLNDEQYEILNEEFPIFLKGSAGSGKTTVAIRKAMELEEYQEYKIGYITFTRSLKEKAQEMYEKFRDFNDEKMVKFYSLEELYEKELKEKPVGSKIYEKFIYEFNPTRPKGIEDLELYQEIRGIIKGSMGASGNGNWKRDLSKEMIPKEDYLAFNKKYTVYDKKEREEIYSFAKKYQNWLEANNYLDENDLARRVILKNQPKFDCIICDEVQDLTEIEIYMLKKLIKNEENLLFAGDIHQIINPTYFSFSRVKSLFYEEKYTERSLFKNYRSQKKIVDLANQLTVLRGKYIGKLGEDYKEASILGEEDIFIYKKDFEFLKKLEENTTIILVPTPEIKKQLREELVGVTNKILTVQDIKGLEFDSVVLYNFGTELKKYWKVIFNGEAKTNQLYRYYFNLLYVGITRAKKRLLLMEEEEEKNCLLDKLNEYLIPLTIEGKRDFTLKSGEKDFLREGKELLGQGLYQEAISAFEKAGAKKYIKKAKNELEADNFFIERGEEETIKYIIENENSLSKCLENYVVSDKLGDFAFENQNYKKAKKYYIKSENFEKLSEIFEINGDFKKSLEMAKKSNVENLIKKLEEKIDKHDRAISMINDIIVLSDKKIKSKEISLRKIDNLNRKYILKKQKKYKNLTELILIGRFTDKQEKKIQIKSPTKLLVKLYNVEGSELAFDYILHNFSDKLNIASIINLVDSGKLISKYLSNVNKKVDMDKLLLKSCDNNQLKNVKKLLELGADIEAKDENMINPIFIAIQNENLDLLKLLVEKGVNLEVNLERAEKETTPLIEAFSVENQEIIDYLLELEIDVNNRNPLVEAVKRENTRAVKRLLELGAVKDIEDLEKNPLYIAVHIGNYEITKLLLEKGSRTDLPKMNLLHVLTLKRDKKIFKLILENKYSINKNELGLMSSSIGNIEISRIYIEHKLGENYLEKLKDNINEIILSKSNAKVNLEEEQEVRYNFEKYKKGVIDNGKSKNIRRKHS